MPWMDSESQRALRWSEVWDRFRPLTPMGQRAKRTLSPFMPGEEADWEHCLDEQECCMKQMEQDADRARRIEECLLHIPDAEPVVAELERGGVPPMVGWFRLKGLLWHGQELVSLWPSTEGKTSVRDRGPWEAVLQVLNPGPVKQPVFALDDAFDPRLSMLRRKVARWERERMTAKEEQARAVERQHGVQRNRDGEWTVERESPPFRALQNDPRVERVRETPFEGVFRPIATDRMREAICQRQKAEEELEQVEQDVLASLAKQIQPYCFHLRRMLSEVVRIDLQWARIKAAREWNGVRPRLDGEIIYLEGAVHPLVAESLEREGRRFTPLDVTMERGTTIVIGPNMGGKTIALKTVGLLTALGQYGFFVPARVCRIPLMPWIRAVIGDGQDERDGLSSFASEVIRLAEGMNRPAGGLLLDEVGRGTNPDEGAALAAAVAEALVHSPTWSFQSTHFREALDIAGIRVYRTAGLRNPHTWKPDGSAAPIDYRLLPGAGEGVSHQAFLIAEGLGLPQGVLERARNRMNRTRFKEGERDGSQTAVGRTAD